MGLARFAGPDPGLLWGVSREEGTLVLWIAVPVAGEGDPRPSKATRDLRKRGAGPWWARQRRASARRRWTLQPAHPRAHDRRCPSLSERDNGQFFTRPSRVVSSLVACPAKADLVLNRGSSTGAICRKARSVAADPVRGGPNLAGQPVSAGGKAIRGCARGSNRSQTRRPGPGKRAAFDEAMRGDGPGASSLGGESNPVNPSAGGATEGVRGRFTTFAPGR